MLPGYPAGVAATSPPYPTPRGAIPWGHPARNSGLQMQTRMEESAQGKEKPPRITLGETESRFFDTSRRTRQPPGARRAWTCGERAVIALCRGFDRPSVDQREPL